MEHSENDPTGPLDKGTRWTQKYNTSRLVRMIVGLYVSSNVPEDDLIIWSTETNGISNPRPYSGRRTAFNRWEPAKAPKFEKNRRYYLIDSEESNRRVYTIVHVFEPGGEHPQVLAVDDLNQVTRLNQSERGHFEDVTP